MRGGEGIEGKFVFTCMETIFVEQYCVMALNLEELTHWAVSGLFSDSA